MDAQLKAKWVEALRSGKYRQGESELYNSRTNSLCCIGVLCRVAGLEIDDTTDRIGDAPIGAIIDRYGPAVKLLDGHSIYQFTARNDGSYLLDSNLKFDKHSFLEIADYIEQNL